MTVAAFPLRTGSPHDFSVLHRLFERTGFRENTVCDRLQIVALDSVDMPIFKTFARRMDGAGPLEVIVRLFLFGEGVPDEELRSHLTDAEMRALQATDLVRASTMGGGEWYSPVRLVPVQTAGGAIQLRIAGDRGDHPDGSPFTPFEDIVFSGHNPLTRQFLRLLPTDGPASVLELGAGSGVAAVALAARGANATATDIAARSTHFALFNAWLNGAQLEVLRGDMYSPVPGRRFRRIVAHPPYVPAFEQRLTYRDGGETGEAIVREVVRGVPDHLERGGTFHVLCLAMDLEGESFEERARRWLGDAAAEFDLIFAIDSSSPPELIATRLTDRSGGKVQDLEQWSELFTRLRVKDFVYGALVGRRIRAGAGEAMTRRVLMTDSTDAAAFEWLFRWLDALRTPDWASRVLDLTPILPPDLILDVRHHVDGGTFAPAAYHLENGGKPFRARLAIEAWVAALLNEFDGTKTAQEVFTSAKARLRVPSTFDENDLPRLLSFLIERGCLVTAHAAAH